MSWQSYVDNSLVGTALVTKGAIFGHDSNMWALSPGFSFTQDEAAAIVQAFSDVSEARRSGLMVEGQKHLVLKADSSELICKKGTGGFAAQKTGQCVVLGMYNEKIHPGQASNTVAKLADFLRENGY